jgi:transcription elongation factor Elf1
LIYKYFECPSCNQISSSTDWNNETKSLCTNPQQLKYFRNIEESKHDKRWYQCPKCKKQHWIFQIKPKHKSEFEGVVISVQDKTH